MSYICFRLLRILLKRFRYTRAIYIVCYYFVDMRRYYFTIIIHDSRQWVRQGPTRFHFDDNIRISLGLWLIIFGHFAAYSFRGWIIIYFRLIYYAPDYLFYYLISWVVSAFVTPLHKQPMGPKLLLCMMRWLSSILYWLKHASKNYFQ